MCRVMQCSAALGRECISMVQCMLSSSILIYYVYLCDWTIWLVSLESFIIFFVIKAFKILFISYCETFSSLLSVRIIPRCYGRLDIILPPNHILDCFPLTSPTPPFSSHSSPAPVTTLFLTYSHVYYKWKFTALYQWLFIDCLPYITMICNQRYGTDQAR